MGNCAIKKCKSVEFKPVCIPGNFGAVVVVPLCKWHYDNIDEYFEYVDKDGNVSKASEYLNAPSHPPTNEENM